MTVNADLIRRTIKAMEENREMWDQRDWVRLPAPWEDEPICGTTLCFAGFALAVHEGPGNFFARVLNSHSMGWSLAPGAIRIEDDARTALGLDEDQAETLFGYMTDDLDDFKHCVTAVTGVTFEEEEPCPA